MPHIDLTAEHVQANTSALAHYSQFQTHRERLTAHTVACAPSDGKGRLCVLGAGNCFDLDLVALDSHYSEIHLVDIDEKALVRVLDRVEPAHRPRFRTHAPVDLSGLFSCIERWSRFQVTPEELMAHPANTASAVRKVIGQSFDVVLSACMLSQMQLSVLHALGDTHRLFQAVRSTLSLTHFRTLAELTNVNGRTLFATDVTAAPLYPLNGNSMTGLELLAGAMSAGKVFDFADPKGLQALLLDDPVLKRAFPTWSVADAWLWTNGPATMFLVYASALQRV